ncbi:MAG: Tim44-like domain-containing protein [Telluria sp.]|nr:Tim44-like domain-containing protein [Telluria sp.]
MKKLIVSTLFALTAMTASAQATAPAEQDIPWRYIGGGALVVAAGFFVYRAIKGKDTPVNGPVTGFNQAPTPAAPAPARPVPAAPVPAAPPAVPGIFDSAAFLTHAKASFIRMQAAWDKADTSDLRQFTTAQVFAELEVQIQGRGNSADNTEVVSIQAVLLGIEAVGTDHLASVKFDGMIKAAPDAPAQAFSEVWNMSKPLNSSSGWVLAGIQQLS